MHSLPLRRQLFEERAQATGVAASKRKKRRVAKVVVEEISAEASAGELHGLVEGVESPDASYVEENGDNAEILFGHPAMDMAAEVSTAIPCIFAACSAIALATECFSAAMY